MKFIKNHSISCVNSPFLEMEILPLIENLKDAKEYAANIGKEIEYYSGREGCYYVPKSIVGDGLFFIVINSIDTYDIIELNKNEEIEIKDGICSIKKKRVLDFYIIAPLFLALLSFCFLFLLEYLFVTLEFLQLYTLLNSILLFYLGVLSILKERVMQKVSAVYLELEDVISHFGDIKDHIIKQLLVRLSYGLKECSAVTVSEELFHELNEREFRIETFVMTPTELKKAIRLVKTAEIILPDDHKWTAKQLYFILTCKEGTESDNFIN